MNVIRYLPICSSSPSVERRVVDPLAVDEGPVERSLILDVVLAVLARSSTAWLRDTVTSSRKISQSGERPIRVRSPRLEALPRPAAARAHDERRPFQAEVLMLEVVPDFLRREGLRRFRRMLSLREERAAARAVVRRLGVLEAALLAVDDAHQAFGDALPVRMSVRRSTSTWSRTLRPPDFCSRATSSARKMSIFPCNRRRW